MNDPHSPKPPARLRRTPCNSSRPSPASGCDRRSPQPCSATATPAFAASRDGVCDTGEFCYYFNSGEAGSISDFTGSIADYGTTQPSCYDFKGAGAGKGKCVKNNAASVWNRSSKTVRVYFNFAKAATA